MKYAGTTDHSAFNTFKTASILNAAMAVYITNTFGVPCDYEADVRKELAPAFQIRIAQYPYLTQMESNIIADYFTAPAPVKPKKAKRMYEVVIVLYPQPYGGKSQPTRTTPVCFPQKGQAIRYAKEKVQECGKDCGASAHIVKDSPWGWAEYEASYSLEGGLTVY